MILKKNPDNCILDYKVITISDLLKNHKLIRLDIEDVIANSYLYVPGQYEKVINLIKLKDLLNLIDEEILSVKQKIEFEKIKLLCKNNKELYVYLG